MSQISDPPFPSPHPYPHRPRRASNPPDPPLTLLHPVPSNLPQTSLPDPLHPIYTHSHRLDSSIDREYAPDAELTNSHRQGPTRTTSPWSISNIGSGIRKDISSRLPYYLSDWTDAWNYRVIPSTAFIFFANILPGLAFSLDLIETTGEYGVQEVLLSSFMAAFVFSVLGGQPLLISGVTGPITVFNKTIYDIFHHHPNFIYLHFIGWVYLWAAILHWIAALLGAVRGLKYVTRFSCDTFGFYVSAVYVQYGIQTVTRQFSQSSVTASILGVLLAVMTLVLPHYFNAVAGSGYTNKQVRRFCADYGMPITIIAVTGLAYWGRFDRFVREPSMTLPTTSTSFQAVKGRPWLVRFWQLEGKWVGIAFPFGLVLFILFYFDANVSSLIAQGSEYPLKKPPGFHWDFFLLGVTTFIAGLLGIPAPNGLIPQAPLHTASLVVLGYDAPSSSEQSSVPSDSATPAEHPKHSQQTRNDLEKVETESARINDIGRNEDRRHLREVPVGVVEQRVSNLAQGTLCLILMTTPFEHVLGLIPKGVMAGLFWYMGTDALLSSGITSKLLFLVRDRRSTSPDDPLHLVRPSRMILFTFVELLAFGATFAITQTKGAIGFPVIIMLLVPIRVWFVPRMGFKREELEVLDGPVASEFTLESVGGSLGR
ncbi:anion transporter [Tremella mesenterica]|uniref:Anion transporter n=1 Tax=Tremella mesenterica TaxID=5217 RepID=A0A4Q1BHW9_TREME|nr:anion transporter [Tremella mesenterica]